MKIIGVITSLLISYFSIGQKSYYFAKPLPEGGTEIPTVDEKWFGTYKSSSEARSYEFNESGLYIITTSISSIGRDAIRESSQYDVRNKLIYGVVKDDSIPCVLKDDRYYFGIKNRDLLISSSSKNKLRKIDNYTYIINFFENGLFTPALIRFEKNKLLVGDFDYEFETTVFDHIQEKETIPGEFHDVVILSPTLEELNELLRLNVFSETTEYKKSRK